MKLGVIGLGKMGTALIKGVLQAEIYSPTEIIASDINKKNIPEIEVIQDNITCSKRAKTLILAIKPQVMDEVLAEIKDEVKDKLVISIAAGISIAHLKDKLPSSTRIIRVMPNAPAVINQGISAYACGPAVLEQDKELVANLFSGIGEVFEVKENLMNAITGLSGSGPAFIYTILEAISDGGVAAGLAREDAIKLTALTMRGAASMVLETGEHPGQLKDMVTSPGGTAITGIEVMERNGMRGIMMETIKKAVLKSQELDQAIN